MPEKRKRGRPEGGKNPACMREYWKLAQQRHRISSLPKEVSSLNKAVKKMGAKKK